LQISTSSAVTGGATSTSCQAQNTSAADMTHSRWFGERNGWCQRYSCLFGPLLSSKQKIKTFVKPFNEDVKRSESGHGLPQVRNESTSQTSGQTNCIATFTEKRFYLRTSGGNAVRDRVREVSEGRCYRGRAECGDSWASGEKAVPRDGSHRVGVCSVGLGVPQTGTESVQNHGLLLVGGHELHRPSRTRRSTTPWT
jgi:hypothetical protein